MPKRVYKTKPNLLQQIGQPIYQLLFWLLTIISFLILFLAIFFQKFYKIPSHLLSLLKNNFSFLLFNKIKISRPSFHQDNIKISKLQKNKTKKTPLPSQKNALKFTLPKLIFFPFTWPNFSYRHLLIILIPGFIFGLLYYQYFYSLPDPKLLRHYPSKLTTQILDRNGILLYKIYKDENRTLIKINDLPPVVKQAFLAAEDKDFYHHFGFSFSGILRALYRNFQNETLEGGSTITQQLVKNTLLSSEKTIDRKIKELVLSVRIEALYTKDEIFEMYLNQVGFGGPAYGIQEAAHQYFNLDAKDLNLSQAAFLAGLPQAPSKYSPYGNHPELSKARQKLVLLQMHKLGYIDQNQMDQALNEELNFNSAKIEIKAPHFVMYIKEILEKQLGDKLIDYGGLTVTTTLDANLQEKVQSIVTEEISKLKNYRVSNGAALVTNPITGEILAMVGSNNYFDLNTDGQVNLTTSLRQPGSSIKPLNYALAFEKGLSPSSTIEDKPLSYKLSGQETWTPKNYDGKFHGTVTIRQALANSYNIPSVILLSKNGITNFVDFAQKLGVSTWTDPARFGLSMALGSLEVKMVDMVTAYSTFANHGVTTPVKSILNITRNDGKQIDTPLCDAQTYLQTNSDTSNSTLCNSQQNISAATAYFISDILSDNLARASAFGFNSVLNIPNAKVAVKTGTSNDLKDNWTFGYTPNLLVGTWVGNNNNQPMANIASGITGASPIWASIIKHLLTLYPDQAKTGFTIPDSLTKIAVCSLTGSLPCDGCPIRYEYYEKDKAPKNHCDPEQIKIILENQKTNTAQSKPQIL